MAAAERAKTSGISSAEQIEPAARAIARQSRRFASPRLAVLTVENAIWRGTVDRFAAGSAALLIDVSRPGESLLWEVEQVGQAYPGRCVFIGHYERLLQMPGVLEVQASDGSVSRVQPTATPTGPIWTRLTARLDGHVVVAYSTDRRGIRRFGRALRARLAHVG